MNLQKLICSALRQGLAGDNHPTIPAGGDLLWRWFLELSGARRVGFSGPEPIALADIEAYARLTGWPIEGRHVAVLQAMDATFLTFFREERERESGPRPGSAPIISKRPLSAGLLDTMFS